MTCPHRRCTGRLSWWVALRVVKLYPCHPRSIAYIVPIIYLQYFGRWVATVPFLCVPVCSFMHGASSSLLVFVAAEPLDHIPQGLFGSLVQWSTVHPSPCCFQRQHKWVLSLTVPAICTQVIISLLASPCLSHPTLCMSRTALPLQYWIQTILKPSQACRTSRIDVFLPV